MTSAISRSLASLPLSASRHARQSPALGRVITDLLEAHQRREHDAATFHPRGSLELSRQVGHRLLIESRLLACQWPKRPDLRSCPAVGDHDLSVFRRRRMYGRTSVRSGGSYGLWGCDERRLVNVANAVPDPSRPGLRKSKMDQRVAGRLRQPVCR